ncbi:hypothetical protein SAMN05443245_6685 [Paraburkholderia fungorum]|uniref:Uncharacterized protein n=1 Tax=Paraburkholderia fungorum TaxID=134537 RepID=A0A1H1JKN5_9BURK|nr:hypothetical protein [Paraburkholderia fungorum]SDR50512.1 hypothetical protein SAMN05443245_6685 [Paraburkholderia fungorum]
MPLPVSLREEGGYGLCRRRGAKHLHSCSVNNLLPQGIAQGVQQSNQANHAINQVARSAYAGVAAAMAMPNMTSSGPGRTIVAAGVGNYKNGSA